MDKGIILDSGYFIHPVRSIKNSTIFAVL